MRFLSMRELRTSTGLLNQMLANDGKIVLTNNGKPAALMLQISETNFEEVLTDLRTIQAKKALRDIQMQSAKNGLADMSMDEINAEIAQARKERREKSRQG